MSWTEEDVVSSTPVQAWSDEDIVPESALSKTLARAKNFAHGMVNPVSNIESALQMGTGMAGTVIGGVHGLGKTLALLAGGKSFEDAAVGGADTVRDDQQTFTYQPRTEGSQEVMGSLGEVMSLPGRAAGSVLGSAGSLVGPKTEAAGQSIGEILPDVATTLYGAPPLVRALRKGAATKAATKEAATLKATQDAVEKSYANGARIDAFNYGKEAGFKTPAMLVNDGDLTVTERFARPQNVLHDANKFNEAVTVQRAKAILGEDGPALTADSFRKAEERAMAPYREIEQLPVIPFKPEFRDAVTKATGLSKLKPDERAAIGQSPKAMEDINRMLEAAQGLDSVSGESAITMIKKLRDDYRDTVSGAGGLAEKSMGAVKKNLADAIESQLDQSGLPPDLLKRYQQGRKEYAQIQQLKDATNQSTFQIDLQKLAKAKANGELMTGELGKLADYANEFAPVTQSTNRGMPVSSESVNNGVASIAGYTAGAPAYAATKLGVPYLTKILRKKALSDEFLSKHGNMVDRRPPVVAPEPPAPLSLAPQGEPIISPSTRGPMIQPRSTLELADPNSTVAALRRGTGARTPMNDAPVEFTPGGGQDFPMRQEVLQHPEISSVVNRMEAKAADLRSKIQNSQGFWKQKYQAELNQLEQEFQAGMDQLGIRSPQEAIGLQPLYEGQTQGRLPVQKVFDPRIDALRRK